MTKKEIYNWLREDNNQRLEKLFSLADSVRREYVGVEVHLRGLIEFSNVCVRRCAYCGMRAPNSDIRRYSMTREEIMECVDKAHKLGYGTVVLQSGEDDRVSPDWLADLIQWIKDNYPLAVTLSVGEHSHEHYRLWREKGADRYLLRFETSDPELYKKIHPPRISGEPNRIELLKVLKDLGYETGGGVMIGLPGQSYDSLARDIELFGELDLDMIGVGPYIPNLDSPLGLEFKEKNDPIIHQVPNTDLITYKVIALSRIICPEANIPATTALATVDPYGFEGGLRAGANVIMPNLTPLMYKALYQIYPVTIHQSPDDQHWQIIKAIIASDRWPGKGRGDRVCHHSPNDNKNTDFKEIHDL